MDVLAVSSNIDAEYELEQLVISIFDALSTAYYDGYQAQAVRDLLIDASHTDLFEVLRRQFSKRD